MTWVHLCQSVMISAASKSSLAVWRHQFVGMGTRRDPCLVSVAFDIEFHDFRVIANQGCMAI